MLTSLFDKGPECASDAGTACALVWKLTGNEWLAESADVLFFKPLRILLIIALCLVARGLINRAIKRLTKVTVDGKSPRILRPFRERVPNLMTDTDAEELLGDRRKQRAETIGSLLRSLVTWLIFAIMFLLILSELNINIGPILASAGVAGLAIGFGAQALVKDIISGLFMIMEDQYGVGDIVDLGEAVGTVQVVGLRVTTLRDLQGTLWYVRNGEIIRVGNQSQSWANIVLDLPLPPSVDVDAATEAISQAATSLTEDEHFSEHVLAEPDVQGVVDMSVDATVIRVLIKVDSAQQWAIGRELRRRIAHTLRESGIADEVAASRVYVPRSSGATP